MGLTSLLLAIVSGLICFLGPAGIIFAVPLSLIALIFGIIGIKKKQNTGIAGTVFSILVLLVSGGILFYVTVIAKMKIF